MGAPLGTAHFAMYESYRIIPQVSLSGIAWVDLIISPNPYNVRPTDVLSNRFLLMLDISHRISFYIGEKIGERGDYPSPTPSQLT